MKRALMSTILEIKMDLCFMAQEGDTPEELIFHNSAEGKKERRNIALAFKYADKLENIVRKMIEDEEREKE